MQAFSDPDLPLGCLVTNVAVEGDRGTTRMGRRIAASITRAEDTFYRVLRAAQVEGAVDPRADARAIARFLVANTHGLSALAKAVADISALRDVVGVVLASVDGMLSGGSLPANANRGCPSAKARGQAQLLTDARAAAHLTSELRAYTHNECCPTPNSTPAWIAPASPRASRRSA